MAILGRMLDAMPENEALRDRVYRSVMGAPIEQEIRLFHALERSWKSGSPDGKGSEFRFEEIQDFTPPLKWDKHEGSVPNKLFRVHMRQDDGSWLALPVNVGARIVKSPTKHQGHADILLEDPFLTLKGERPRTAVISGYVHDHHDKIIDNKVPNPNGGRDIQLGLRGKDIRGKVETAFMHMLYSVDTGLTQSSILFNVRDNPIKGVVEALSKLYVKFNKLPGAPRKDVGIHTVLPIGSQFSQVVRAKNREAKHRGEESNVSDAKNGSVWIAYFDPKVMDTSRIPKLDVMRAFASKECVELSNRKGRYKGEPPIALVEEYFDKVKRVVNAAYGKGKNPLRDAVLAGDAELLPKEVFTPENLLMSGGLKLAEKGPNVHMMARTQDASRGKADRATALLDKLNAAMNVCVMGGCRFDPQAKAGDIADMLWEFDPGRVPKAPKTVCIDDFEYKLRMVQGKFSYVGLGDVDGQDISGVGSYDQLGHVPSESFTKEVLLCCDVEGRTLVEVMAEKNRLNLVPKTALKEALEAMGLEGVEAEDLLDGEDVAVAESLRERLDSPALV